jgi:hypothetical protein
VSYKYWERDTSYLCQGEPNGSGDAVCRTALYRLERPSWS